MYKQIGMVAIVASFVGACGTPGNMPSAPTTGPGILAPLVSAGIIKQSTRDKAVAVQQQTAALCNFVPTIASVVALFSAGVGGGVGGVAAAACAAATSVPLADGGTRRIYVTAPSGKRIRLEGTINGRKV